MKKTLFLIYGLIAYAMFFITILYAMGFVSNLFVPKSIDGTPQVPVMSAILTNAGLLFLFALQHSVMARPGFKEKWTTIVPKPIERSTYVLLASICLLLMMWQWQPLGGMIWQVKGSTIKTMLTAISFCGWLIVFISSFMINHFDLFGLRQVWFYFKGKPYTEVKFGNPLFYRIVRHPLYFGFLLAFWCTPVMSATHLLFAAITTLYILTAIVFEEKDLSEVHGEKYRLYKQTTPRIIPFGKRKTA